MTNPSSAPEDRPTIVIVDDDEVQLRYLEIILDSLGCRIVTARNGLEGFEYLMKNNADFIVLDVSMPWLNGIDLCGRVKLMPHLRDVPVAIVSARGDEQAQELARQVRADHFLQKPIVSRAFRDLVAERIGSRASNVGQAA